MATNDPLTAESAYRACLPKATRNAAVKSLVTVASFDKTHVVQRADGRWFVYLTIVDKNAGYNGQVYGVGCVVGGTEGNPAFLFTNNGDWTDPMLIDANRYEHLVPTGYC